MTIQQDALRLAQDVQTIHAWTTGSTATTVTMGAEQVRSPAKLISDKAVEIDLAVGNLATLVTNTTTSKNAAATSATAAATSATNSATSATASSASATAAAASATAAATSATNAGTSNTAATASATAAATSATNAGNSATAAATSATNAGNSATAAATSASTAQTHSNNAITAWTAATAGMEVLPAVDKVFMSSTGIVDSFIYDTAKDSDGGAWRKRCSNTSWEKETTYGSWLGIQVNETAARAVTGAATDSYYYDTTAAKFYKLNVTTGVTEIFRGNAKQFPAVVAITAEASRVIIWDLTQPNVPMWMVFKNANNLMLAGNATTSSLACLNGTLVAGDSTYDVHWFSFIEDKAYRSVTITGTQACPTLASRNQAISWVIINTNGIVNRSVNDVAITVLPDAPIDTQTGLPVPTIAVATAGGVSVIKHDGTVVNVTGFTYPNSKVSFLKSGEILTDNGNNRIGIFVIPSASITISSIARQYSESSVPAGWSLPFASNYKTIAGNTIIADAGSYGLTRVIDNPSSQASSMVAYTTNTYNTGWMVGDIRRCFLANSPTLDRSVKAATLTVVGTPTETTYAGGRSVYSGFSAANYLQEASHADWNAIGTGDFSIVMSGVKWGTAGIQRTMLSIGNGTTTGSVVAIIYAGGTITLWIHNGTTWASLVTTTTAYSDISEHTIEFKRSTVSGVANTLSIVVDGVVSASAVSSATISNTTGFLRIGERQEMSGPWIGGQCACVRISATAPTTEQSKLIAAQENALNGGIPCLIDGTSTAVTTLSYDDVTDLVDVGTSWGRSTFKGLQRVESEATTNGAAVSYSSYGGSRIQVGATGGRVYVPSKSLRNELNKGREPQQRFLAESVQFGKTSYDLYNGDQQVIGIEASKTRIGSWTGVTTGDMYTLLTDMAVWYRSHNVALNNATGNFLGRDDTGKCELVVQTESGLLKTFSAVTAAAGIVPVWVLTNSIDLATGSVTSSGTGGIGYATGAGGVVTQATSKATGVTLNKVCGDITLNAASLAADTAVSFVLTNSAIAATDLVMAAHVSAGTLGSYNIAVTPAAGSATITVRNVTPGALAEAIVIRISVIKGVLA